MLAAKLMDDHYYNNAYYAKVPFDFRPTFCNLSDVYASPPPGLEPAFALPPGVELYSAAISQHP